MSDQLLAPIALSSQELATLAREIAIDIKKTEDILATYGITKAQFELLKDNAFFRNMLEQEIRNWQSTMGSPDRIKLEAMATFEKLMPLIYTRLTNPGEGLRDVMEGAKLLAKVGNLDANREEKAPGEKFSVTINIGGDEKPIIDIVAEPVRVPIPSGET